MGSEMCIRDSFKGHGSGLYGSDIAVRLLHEAARRLVQEADGYIATVQSGTVTFEEGVHTGEMPGKLIRGRQKVAA